MDKGREDELYAAQGVLKCRFHSMKNTHMSAASTFVSELFCSGAQQARLPGQGEQGLLRQGFHPERRLALLAVLPRPEEAGPIYRFHTLADDLDCKEKALDNLFNMMLIYYTKHFDKLKQLIIQICNDTSARKCVGNGNGAVAQAHPPYLEGHVSPAPSMGTAQNLKDSRGGETEGEEEGASNNKAVETGEGDRGPCTQQDGNTADTATPKEGGQGEQVDGGPGMQQDGDTADTCTSPRMGRTES
eukprot:3037779-Rhodomonas_salina.3